MARDRITPTGREAHFDESDLIVSKTDLKGRITYANDVFCRIAGFTPAELLGQPHSIIRHPDMPRAAFKLVWDTLEAKQEVFAYVLNLGRNGHYWVFAHITPSYDDNGQVVGYHSNRRKPEAAQVAKIAPIYRDLLAIEQREPDRKVGMNKAFNHLVGLLNSSGVTYDQFVFSL